VEGWDDFGRLSFGGSEKSSRILICKPLEYWGRERASLEVKKREREPLFRNQESGFKKKHW
jgi:hypothetical protein